MNTLNKTLLSVALTAVLGTVSNSAMAASVLNDFVVDPDLAPGGTTFTADKITGGYVEQMDFLGASGGTSGTFNASILWTPGQFFANDGTTLISNNASGTGGLGVTYAIYGLFTGSGTWNNTGSGFEFLFNSSNFELWYDLGADTTFAGPGAGNTTNFYTVVQNGVDQRLGFGGQFGAASTAENGGTLTSGTNAGSFGVTETFTLDSAGLLFFIDPRPFYNITFGSGQFNSFTPENGTFQTTQGSADFQFKQVPEPTSLALLGIGLMGLSLGRRKQA